MTSSQKFFYVHSVFSHSDSFHVSRQEKSLYSTRRSAPLCGNSENALIITVVVIIITITECLTLAYTNFID